MALENKKISWFPFAMSGLSFIPLVGVPVGIICLIYGLVRRSRVLCSITLVGILFTFLLYGFLFSQLRNPTGMFFENTSKLYPQTILPGLVKEIEYFKLQNGRYPKDLSEVKSKTIASSEMIHKSLGKLYYSLDPSGSFYYLFMTGPNGKPFTEDNLLPSLSKEEMKRIGLRTKRSR